MKTRFIVNPQSGDGATRRKWPAIENIIKSTYPSRFEIVFTDHALQETQLAREGIQSGCDRIISVGGDGTLNGVLNGFFQDGRLLREPVALGVLQIGTGADFTRTIGVAPEMDDTIRQLALAQPHRIDVGEARFVSMDGSPGDRYFINILDFGIGGAVVERITRTTKRFGGRAAFLWAILGALLRYRNKEIRYRLDGGEWSSAFLNNFIVANGRYFGSGLFPAPQAELDDGWFDVVLFGNIGTWEAIRSLPSLRAGTHLSNPHVQTMQARRIEAESDAPIYIDLDGDLVGRLPISISILPGALPLLK
jgi:YegS/Rv2252/BmrU family lipid kinase